MCHGVVNSTFSYCSSLSDRNIHQLNVCVHQKERGQIDLDMKRIKMGLRCLCLLCKGVGVEGQCVVPLERKTESRETGD